MNFPYIQDGGVLCAANGIGLHGGNCFGKEFPSAESNKFVAYSANFPVIL